MRCIRALCSTPSSPNYFTLFSLTPSYSIDLPALSTRYKELQSEYHPDKHTNSPAEEQERAATKSALLNKAYRCLRDPYCRAKTLLQYAGQDPTVSSVENEFLMEMMDFNDEVEMYFLMAPKKRKPAAAKKPEEEKPTKKQKQETEEEKENETEGPHFYIEHCKS
eukprot:sb/3472546/